MYKSQTQLHMLICNPSIPLQRDGGQSSGSLHKSKKTLPQTRRSNEEEHLEIVLWPPHLCSSMCVSILTHINKCGHTHTHTETLALGFSVSHSNPVTQTDHDFTVSSVHLPPHVLTEEMYSGSHTEGLRAQILKVEHDSFLYLLTFLLARTLSPGHASLHGKWADAGSPMEKNSISTTTVIWTHIHTDTICTHKFASTQLLYNVTFWSYTLVC